MVQLTFKVDYKKVSNDLLRKEKGFDRQLNKLMGDLLLMGTNFVMDEAPYVTGRLRGATKNKQTSSTSGFIFVSTQIAPHFNPVYFGRRAVDIVPIHAKALFWPGARHPVKRVHQKARKGNKYVDRAVPRLEAVGQQRLNMFVKWLEA